MRELRARRSAVPSRGLRAAALEGWAQEVNKGMAAVLAALSMMDPDDVPPLPERYRDVPRDDGQAEAKRERKAARQRREQEATAEGRRKKP